MQSKAKCNHHIFTSPAASQALRSRETKPQLLPAGPLKSALLSYFALTSDHTQRLQSVRANGKFSSLQATPETPMSRTEDLASIVRNAKVCSPLTHDLHAFSHWKGVSHFGLSVVPGAGKSMPMLYEAGVQERQAERLTSQDDRKRGG